MAGKKLLASVAASAIVLTGVAATPTIASAQNSRPLRTGLNKDTGLWLFGGFVISEAILVAILASDKKPGGGSGPSPR